MPDVIQQWDEYYGRPTSDVPQPDCEGFDKPHRSRLMKLIGLEDDGTHIWRCPRCLYVWRERPDSAASTRKQA